MDKRQFDLSLRLFNDLGSIRLSSGGDFSKELRLGGAVSFWDVVAPYLVLYRFPLLFGSDKGRHTGREWLKYGIRPLRGMAAGLRDSALHLLQRNDVACEQWPAGEPVVLFLYFTRTFYRDVLRPVAESLAKRGIRVIVLGSGRTQKNFSFSGRLTFQSCWSHWNTDTQSRAQSLQRHLSRLRRSLLDEKRRTALRALRLNNFSRFGLTMELRWLFRRELCRLIPQAALAQHILDKHRPDLIISADDADQRCRLYSLLARTKGILTLLVQQGLSGKDYPEWVFFSHSAVAAMGESSAEDMRSQGVAHEKIRVTGNPGFDCLCSPGSAPAETLAKLGLSKDRKIALFASQPYYVGVFDTPGIRRAMIKDIITAAVGIDNLTLIVKPHPGENMRELKNLIGRQPQAMLVDKTADISLLIQVCDVFITFFSTAALQALYAGKPVVNVDFPGSGGLPLYSEGGATWVARSPEEISKHLRDLIGESRERKIAGREAARLDFLRKMAYLPDGRATERVTATALSMLTAQ